MGRILGAKPARCSTRITVRTLDVADLRGHRGRRRSSVVRRTVLRRVQFMLRLHC